MRSFLLFFGVAALVIVSATCGGEAESKYKPEADSITHAMGYGAGIHHFKNYVLRHTDNYRADAVAEFTKAETALAAVLDDPEITSEMKSGAMAMQLVVQSYLRAIPVAQAMIAEGRSVEEIDRVVKVADAPGTWGLEMIRTGSKWNSLQELQYAMGYGGAIHNFKNYVLRGGLQATDVVGGNFDNYRAASDQQWIRAETLVGEVKAAAKTDEEKAAADQILSVINQYKANLAVAKQMHGEAKTIQEIDTAVKVDDAPALAGFDLLRGSMGL
jgi:methyl-accepting chemotaxis protein